MNHFPSVYVIIYLGHVILYYFGGYSEKSLSLCIATKRLTSGPLIICFKNVSGYSQPIRNVGNSLLFIWSHHNFSFLWVAQSREILQDLFEI